MTDETPAVPSAAASVFLRDLNTIRCSGCGKIVCRSTRNAVAAGELIEIKCSCNQKNYLMGSIDAA